MAKTIKQKDINLISAMYQVKKAPSKLAGKGLLILVIVLILALIGAALAFLLIQQSRLTAEKAELEYYINDPQTQAQQEEAIRAQQEATDMESQSYDLENVLLNISSLPYLNSKDIKTIYGYAENRVTIENMNFSRDTGVLSFTATGDTPTVIPIFIAQLRMSTLFADVQYQGYSGGAQTSGGFSTDPITGEYSEPTTSESFSFSVTCLLNAPVPTLPTEPANQPVTEAVEDEEDDDE